VVATTNQVVCSQLRESFNWPAKIELSQPWGNQAELGLLSVPSVFDMVRWATGCHIVASETSMVRANLLTQGKPSMNKRKFMIVTERSMKSLSMEMMVLSCWLGGCALHPGKWKVTMSNITLFFPQHALLVARYANLLLIRVVAKMSWQKKRYGSWL
jgi:hypothetical protein